MAIGTPVPQEDLHPSVYVPQATSNVVPAEDMSGSNSAAATESSTLQPEAAYPAVGAGAALAAQGAGRAVGSKNWFNSDFPEYHPSEPNPLPKNPGEFADGTYKPGSPYTPGVYAPGKPYAPGPEFVRREFPGLPAELDKGPNAVENFALSQHKGPAGEGQFFGGQDYGDAYARAMEAKQFNAGSTGFVVPQGGTPLALPPEIAAQKEQEYKDKLEAERAQREEGARVIHEQQEDKRQAEHNRAEAARRQAHEDREAHRLKTFNDIERQRRDNHAAMEQEKQNRFLTSESERQGAHASRQAEYQLARRAEDARMAQEANQIAKSKLIGMANKLPGQIPLAGWNAGEAAERFQEPGIRNKIAGAVNAAGAVAPFLSHVPKIGKYAGLIGPGAAGLAHLIADEPQGHKAGGHIQHFGRGGQPDQGGPMTADRVINDVKSFGEPLTALGDTLASGLRRSTAATLGGLPDLYNLASAATGDRLGHAPYGSEELKQMFPEVTNDPERMNSNLVKMASAAGDWTPLAGPGEIARGIKGVGKLAGSEINKAMMGEGNSMLRAITPQPMFAAPTSRTISNFDPRFEKRAKEQSKVQNMVVHEEQTGPTNIPKIDITKYEGYPFITGMADRTAAGSKLLGINNIMFNRPVNRTGGQHFMYNNPNYTWAGGDVPTDDTMRLASALKDFTGGKDPLFIPWQMSPTGSDFAHMTGETMLAYAEAAMSTPQKMALDNHMKSIIPDWKGISDPSSVNQFLQSPSNVRKQVQNVLDKHMRDEGGIGLGQARLAITDPEQLVGSDGKILHIGQLHPDKPVLRNSGNFSYPSFAPGVGLGQISGDHNIYELLREKALQRGVIDTANPARVDLRALEMGPQAGILTEKTFRNMGYKKGGLAHLKEAA